MRRDFYVLLAFVLLAFSYACFCTKAMVLENKLPAALDCEGIILDTGRVYVIGTAPSQTADTVVLMADQAVGLMPARLCVITYNPLLRDFEVKNTAAIAVPDRVGIAPFLPFCSTLNDVVFQHQVFYGPGAVIDEKALLDRGIKFNFFFGSRSTRVGLLFRQFQGHFVLMLKHEGIGVAYALCGGGENVFGVMVNAPDTVQQRAVFAFTQPYGPSFTHTIRVNPCLFGADYVVSDTKGGVVLTGNETRSEFLVDGYLFSIRYKYGRPFVTRFLGYLLLFAGFQIVFLTRLWKASSPIIRSLLAFRLLLNAIACLAVPLFLAAYYMTPGREWFLLLVILVNGSFWLPKDVYEWGGFQSKLLLTVMTAVVCGMPVLICLFTRNESLFGVIPVLHCAKLAILMLFYLAELPWFRQSRAHYLLRLTLVLSYAMLLSLLSGDTGTFIYTVMAMVLVELIKTTLRLRVLAAGVLLITCLCYFLFLAHPGVTADRKLYRIYAPYVNPAADELAAANEADRESYTTFLLDLKSIMRLDAPQLNNLLVPANMRSTMHTDFAFHWSMMFGGFAFIVLYLGVTLLLVKHIAFLLFCAARECRVKGDLCFCFPKSRLAESIRILLAFTLVSFVFPVLSNLLLIPVTGQSIPLLSISVIEPAFILLLLTALENIFNNPAYYVAKPQVRYTYRQLLEGFRWSFTLSICTFLVFLLVRYIGIWREPETYAWKKMGDKSGTLDGQTLPGRKDKAALTGYADQVIAAAGGANKLNAAQKNLLLNLAACFYSGKPFFQMLAGGGTFSNSRPLLLKSMNVDSLRRERARRISGTAAPFGAVYSFVQRLNDKAVRRVSNRLYATIPAGARTVNGDLTAELNVALAAHLAQAGPPSNIGAIMVVDNHNGHVLANSLYPLQAAKDANDVYYFIGSLKKLLVAYCALEIDSNYRHAVYNGISFDNFIRFSNDAYAGFLLKDLLARHRDAFNAVLSGDFSLPLESATSDAYLDAEPPNYEFARPMDRKNSIYRLAIGQQRPYPLSTVVQWYCRVASGRRLVINYGDSIRCAPLMMDSVRLKLFRHIFNSVLNGTAGKVGAELKSSGVNCGSFFCKTGTAESAAKAFNASSSFIIADQEFTVAIMLSGQIPRNEDGLAAKDLFIKVMPILFKYHILPAGRLPQKTRENPALLVLR
jgi:hypothetical protein